MYVTVASFSTSHSCYHAAASSGAPSTPSIKTSSPNGLTIKTPSSNVGVGGRSSILKSIIKPVLALIPSRGNTGRSSRSQRDGLIASPRASAPSSPASWGADTSFPSNGPGYFGGPPSPTPSATLSPQATFGRFPSYAASPNGSPQIGYGRPPGKCCKNGARVYR